jgi:DNA-binding NtrC family response regulator
MPYSSESQITIPHPGPSGVELTVTSFALEVIEGPDRGKRFAIDGASPTRLSLGTSSACELRVSDTAVSRRHAALSAEADGLRITDLESTNGTFIGVVRLYDATLAGGELVRVGGTTLRVERRADVRALEPAPRGAFGKLVGASDEMRRMYPLLDRLARSDVPVIVEGETGTGKEVLAEALHDQGVRREGPFIVFDCTAVPASLLESALFGHEKGAFTGAVSQRAGVFEQAHGGTLLIDEIGDLDIALQPKLLRAIQRSEVQRVGSNKWIRVDVRVIAATRRDLDREVAAGRFRDDLFYRLNVGRVELPPLRRRKSDIPVLVRHFWRAMGGDESALSPDLLVRFQDYAWPGNVRELYNAVARQLALGDLANHAPPTSASQLPAIDDESTGEGDPIGEVLALDLGLIESRDRVVRAFEKRYLSHLLDRHGGNVTRAAESAGIARRYFHELLRRARA